MALILSNTGIVDGQTITAAQISQSIDALTGAAAYDIIISGSLNLTGSTVTGSTANITSITGSLNGIAASGSKVYIASNTSTNAVYSLVFKNNTQALNNYHELAADTGGPLYNPSNNSLTASIFSGTLSGSFSGSGNITSASYAVSSSYAVTASYLEGSVNNAIVAYTVSGSFIATGSTSPTTPAFFRFLSGYGITDAGTGQATVNIPEIGTKQPGRDLFITTAVSGSSPVLLSYNVNATAITFYAQSPLGPPVSSEFTYMIMYT